MDNDRLNREIDAQNARRAQERWDASERRAVARDEREERLVRALEQIAAILADGTKIGGFLNNGKSIRINLTTGERE